MADTVAQRNARLDQLVQLTQSWANTRTQELNNRVAFLKKMLTARGQGSLLNANQQAAQQLVVSEINTFLAGS
jgi:hypothetical protein